MISWIKKKKWHASENPEKAIIMRNVFVPFENMSRATIWERKVNQTSSSDIISIFFFIQKVVWFKLRSMWIHMEAVHMVLIVGRRYELCVQMKETPIYCFPAFFDLVWKNTTFIQSVRRMRTFVQLKHIAIHGLVSITSHLKWRCRFQWALLQLR